MALFLQSIVVVILLQRGGSSGSPENIPTKNASVTASVSIQKPPPTIGIFFSFDDSPTWEATFLSSYIRRNFFAHAYFAL